MTRIEIAPHYDRWMMGDRYGTIVDRRHDRRTGRTVLLVKMDRSGKTIKIDADDGVSKYL